MSSLTMASEITYSPFSFTLPSNASLKMCSTLVTSLVLSRTILASITLLLILAHLQNYNIQHSHLQHFIILKCNFFIKIKIYAKLHRLFFFWFHAVSKNRNVFNMIIIEHICSCHKFSFCAVTTS